ncbi:hypothetical protein N0O92_20670 [Alkalihalobacillus sp. MEB130]|nr:hypothetical protein [Alkalihalobacillus sp. MEB130]MDT8862618.1 hypothetical protein [Alkalihalobacillus sp. MEB130]
MAITVTNPIDAPAAQKQNMRLMMFIVGILGLTFCIIERSLKKLCKL